ncbi:MAG: murein biosynthesis integral membrane protein MurJ [Bdellovibrionales bacterium]
MTNSDQAEASKGVEKQDKSSDGQKSLLFSALGMGAGTLISRVLGLFRDAALAAFFSKTVLDCFAIGFRLPNFFRRVMGEGALSVSFIPSYLELKIKDPIEAEKLKNVTFSFLFCLSALLCILGTLYIGPLLNLIIDKESFSTDPAKFELAVRMAKWMFGYLFLVTQFAYFMSVLNAHKKFWVAGVAPAFFNLGFLVFIFLPSEYVFFTGQQLTWGVLFGGGLQVLIVGLSFVKHFGFPKFNFNMLFKPFRRVLLATTPSLFGIGVLQMISLVNINLCSRVGDGAHGYLYFADRILELPQSLIAVSLGTAMLPSLTEMWIKSRKDFDSTLIRSLRVYLFFGVPSALGLFFLSLPITQLLFQRGAFGLERSVEVASLVQIYGGLLVVSGLSRILLPVYYSFKNTWYPAVSAVLVLVSHYFLGRVFVEEFGLPGVALTTLVSGAVNFGLLLLGLKLFIGRAYVFDILKSALSLSPVFLSLTGFLWLVRGYIPVEKTFMGALLICAVIGGSVLLYFASAVVFKVDEAKIFKKILAKVL